MITLDFDRLLDVPTLRTALGDATGRDVHVALLDTGVDVTHPDLQGTVVRSIEVVAQGREMVCRDVAADQAAGRATRPGRPRHRLCRHHPRLAPAARLISVRVIGASAAGTGEQFVRGLQWVLEQRPRIHAVNLSLGTVQDRFAVPLRRLVDQAYFQGTVLVAAANNMGVPSYPAVFASLLAVDNDSFSEPTAFKFQTGRPMELVARGIYVRAPKSGGGYQLWTGTSFACPHITALVARLLSLNLALTPFQIKTLLHVLRATAPPRRARNPDIPSAGKLVTQARSASDGTNGYVPSLCSGLVRSFRAGVIAPAGAGDSLWRMKPISRRRSSSTTSSRGQADIAQLPGVGRLPATCCR